VNLDRRLLLVVAAFSALLLAIPSLALARTAFVTGSEQSGGAHAARWNLATQAMFPPETSFGGESSGLDVAITPDGTRAYAVVSGKGVVPFSVATGIAGTPINVGISPQQIAIAPDGAHAYVTDFFGATVSVIDLAGGTATGTIAVGSETMGIAVTPDGTRAYVVNHGGDSVSVINLASGTVTGTIAVGNGPTGIAITPDGTRAYVANQFDETVSRIALASGTVTSIAAPGLHGTGLSITPNGERAYVIANFGSSSEVMPINLTTDMAGSPVATSGFLEDIAILPNGSRAYIADESPDQLIPFDIAGNTALPGFAVGNRPEAVAIIPNQPPHAVFTPSLAGTSVSFDASASSDPETAPEAPGSVVRYDWSFGDGSAATNAGATPKHTYAKGGTYTVTLTTTDNEGCSTQQVFTGQTMYCNGSAIARTTRTVAIPSSSSCTRVKANAGSFVPKRRPGKVVPGVRVLLTANAPAKLAVDAKIEWSRKHGGTGNASLGNLKVEINEWRRLRFPIPDSLREELPLGTAVTVKLKIETTPRDATCTPTFTNRLLHLHVVKVFADAVQFKRAR
jgi:YVTN family beta-propeller protein